MCELENYLEKQRILADLGKCWVQRRNRLLSPTAIMSFVLDPLNNSALDRQKVCTWISALKLGTPATMLADYARVIYRNIHPTIEDDELKAQVANMLGEYANFIGRSGQFAVEICPEIWDRNATLNAQTWWCLHMESAPNLFIVACRVFCIPASSGAAERVWKCCADTKTKRRNRLREEKMGELVIVKALLLNSGTIPNPNKRPLLQSASQVQSYRVQNDVGHIMKKSGVVEVME